MVPQTNMLQVKSLGTCLSGDAQEWYVRNVEHHSRAIQEWTLESALKGLQEKFLHSLTHRHAATKFDATQQGSSTVQDLLNKLEKYASQMVDPPDPYMMCRNFLAALRDSLRREVLMRGHTAEYSSLSESTETAACIEDAVRYDIGTWPLEQTGGSYATHMRPAPQWAQAIEQHWPQPTGTRTRETAGRSPLVAQAKPSVQRGGLAHPTANSQSRLAGQ